MRENSQSLAGRADNTQQTRFPFESLASLALAWKHAANVRQV